MDTIYIGDIPSSYHYAIFSNDYITLYNRSSLTNGTFDYYRIYYNSPYFIYSQGSTQVGQYNTTYCTDVDVSSSWWYRHDLCGILTCTLIIVLFFTFLLNIFSSVIKKGGVFGGLL